MKRYITPILTALALTACTGTVADKGGDIDTAGHTLFSVDTESLEIAGDSFTGAWENGARIGVFGSETGSNVPYYLRRSDAGLQAAAFYGELVKGSVQAYFPYDEGLQAAFGAIPCELERLQAFEAGADMAQWFLRYNPRTFASPGEDGVLHFRYPMGLLDLRFEFSEAVNISSITLNSTSGISGRLSVDAEGNVLASGLSHKYISLDLGGTAVSSKSGDGFTDFLIVLPPRTYADGELSLLVETDDEEMAITLKETVVRRVESSSFPVTAIIVGSSDIPGYEKENGYLE